MDSSLNGVSPETLIARIESDPADFQLDGEEIIYLGKALSLVDGKVVIGEHAGVQPQRSPLHSKLVAIKPDVLGLLQRQELARLKPEADQLLKASGTSAFYGPHPELLKAAIVLRLIETDPDRAGEYGEHLMCLSEEDRFQAANALNKKTTLGFDFDELGLNTPGFRFRMAAESLKRSVEGGPALPPNLLIIKSCDSPLRLYEQLHSVLSQQLPEYVHLFNDVMAEVAQESNMEKAGTQCERIVLAALALKGSKLHIPEQACKELIAAFVHHKFKRNMQSLLTGLYTFARADQKVQEHVASIEKGGNTIKLAAMQMAILLDGVINSDQFVLLTSSLIEESKSRKALKDNQTFQQWQNILTTLRNLSAVPKADKLCVLEHIASSPRIIHENLIALRVILSAGSHRLPELVQRIEKVGLKNTMEELLSEVLPVPCEQDVSPELGWVGAQRDSYLLPVYYFNVLNSQLESSKEILSLLRQSVQNTVEGNFSSFRHNTKNNDHLKLIYRLRPDWRGNWISCCKPFDSISLSELPEGHRLELSESFWDLFISGHDLRTCLTPEGNLEFNRALTGYIADGRNGMLVIKNASGVIRARTLIRVLTNPEETKTVLLMEPTYTLKPDEALNRVLLQAAKDVASQLGTPLCAAQFNSATKARVLPGAAPFDYFDSLDCCTGQETCDISIEVIQPVTS